MKSKLGKWMLMAVAALVLHVEARPVVEAFGEGIRYDAVKAELKGEWVPAKARARAEILCARLDDSIAKNEKLLGGATINYEDFKGELAAEAKVRHVRQKELLLELEELLGLYAYASQIDYNDYYRGGRTYDQDRGLTPPQSDGALRDRFEGVMKWKVGLDVGDHFANYQRFGISSVKEAEVLWQIVEEYRGVAMEAEEYPIMLNAAYWFNRLATDEQAERLRPLVNGEKFRGRYFGHLLRQRKDPRWLKIRHEMLVVEEMGNFFRAGAKGGKTAFLERVRPCGASPKEIIWGLLAVADSCCQKPRGSDLEKLGVMALEFTVPLEDIAVKEERPDSRYAFIAESSQNECAWTALKCYYDYHERMGSPFGKWKLKSMLSVKRQTLTPEMRKRIEDLQASGEAKEKVKQNAPQRESSIP